MPHGIVDGRFARRRRMPGRARDSSTPAPRKEKRDVESSGHRSLDEEAANMMKWQANFTASSKVITTIDEMLDTVLQLKR